ncbi:MAG: RNA polymerase sigma factor [Myxococcota bacterium]
MGRNDLRRASCSEKSDEELARRIQSGDRQAFEAVVRRHGSWLLAVCRRYLRDEHLAQDTVQEVLLSVYRHAESYTQSGPFTAWMRRIAVNASLMALRKKARVSEEPIDDLLPRMDGLGCRIEPSEREYLAIEELLDRKYLREMILESIQRLPDSHRVVLMLRDVEGYTTAEAAEALEINEGALKVRLHRARSALKKLLEPVLKRGGIR